MDCLWITGGKSLKGEVQIPPAKNAALPLLCLSLLTSEKVTFKRLPDVADVKALCSLLEEMGVTRLGPTSFQCAKIKSPVAPYDWVKKMRASILVLGPLLAREGQAEVSLPGGCAIGERPVDIHLDGLKALGADIQLENGYIKAKCKKLKGGKFVMHFPSVTGTINLLMAATLADGTTQLDNVAHEPEVVEIAEALIAMGAKIKGHGTSTISIEGVSKLDGLDWEIQPDRIQLLTYLGASAITGGDITCVPYRQNTMNSALQSFKEMGCEVFEKENSIRVTRASARNLKAVHIETAPFPGFPTDAQAQLMACLSLAEGTSVIREAVFENRFGHVGELRRMGAEIEVSGNTAHVRGVKKLSGTTVMASDLRASASLVLAGLAAEGKTQVTRVYHLDRGYENFEKNLRTLGAEIERARE